MTFSNALQPVEVAAAVGIGLILLMALGYLVVHAARLAREVGLGAVRAAFAALALGGALLGAYVAWRLTAAGGSAPVTLRVEPAGLMYRSSSQPDVVVSWTEIEALTRVHGGGRDAWVLTAGQRELSWDDSVSEAVKLQNLILERAKLDQRRRDGAEGESWTVVFTR